MNLLKSQIKNTLDCRGFTFIEKFQPTKSTLRIARELGEIEKIPGNPRVQKIIPRPKEGTKKSRYSGNFGLEKFPFHTDLAHWYIPPRYIILRCLVPAPSVFTTLVDFHNELTTIPEATIFFARFLPRKLLSGKKSLLPFLQKVDGKDLIRWDSLFIVPANQAATKVCNFFKSFEAKTSGKPFYFKNPSDTLIIDNWRILHGRSAISHKSLGRIIERVYLKEINL